MDIMELIRVICPSCGGELNISKSTDFIFCNFCGNKFALPQRESYKPDISNYLSLADDSLAVGSEKDAIDYYNKVLEHEPNNHKAIIGKGYAVFLGSTLANPKLLEMQALFEKAFSLAHDDEKEAAIIDIKRKTLSACQSYFNLAKSHFNKFRGTGDMFDSSIYDDFHRHCISIILTIDNTIDMSSEYRLLNKELCNFGISVLSNSVATKNSYKVTKKQEFENRIKSDSNWLSDQKEKNKALAQKRYWEEHPEEYSVFIKELNKKKTELELEIRELNSEYDSVRINSDHKIYVLEKERETQGLFAIKKKNKIDNEIEAIKKLQANYLSKITALNSKLKSLEKEELLKFQKNNNLPPDYSLIVQQQENEIRTKYEHFLTLQGFYSYCIEKMYQRKITNKERNKFLNPTNEEIDFILEYASSIDEDVISNFPRISDFLDLYKEIKLRNR